MNNIPNLPNLSFMAFVFCAGLKDHFHLKILSKLAQTIWKLLCSSFTFKIYIGKIPPFSYYRGLPPLS